MILRIYPQNPAEREIRRVVEALERDGVVVYPTDSVYAYGCSLRSARGLERLRQLSGKQTGELSIICDGISRAAEYCRVDNAAFKILKRNLPGSDHLPARRHRRGCPTRRCNAARRSACASPTMRFRGRSSNSWGARSSPASLKSDDDAEYMTDPELSTNVTAAKWRWSWTGDTGRSGAHHGGRPHAGRARNRAAGCGGTQLTDIMTRSNSI